MHTKGTHALRTPPPARRARTTTTTHSHAPATLARCAAMISSYLAARGAA
jgi:hypothetical protein